MLCQPLDTRTSSCQQPRRLAVLEGRLFDGDRKPEGLISALVYPLTGVQPVRFCLGYDAVIALGIDHAFDGEEGIAARRRNGGVASSTRG